MPQSMTGYAKTDGASGELLLSWQFKSVNQRFLDISLRLPDGCGELEMAARNHLKALFNRGRIEGALNVERERSPQDGLEFDPEVVRNLLRAEKRLSRHAKGKRGRLSLDRLLSWPGVLLENRPRTPTGLGNDPKFQHSALVLLEQACARLADSRGNEGRETGVVMTTLLNELETLRQQAAELLPTIRDELESRLRARIQEMGGLPVEESRLGQEIAFFFNRLDVAEEMARLQLHIKEMHATLATPEPVGRRLDFLCQELNREVNTLCSKSQDANLTRLGVDMKVVVEKLREQAQNLE